MSVKEIEQAISRLSPSDVAELSTWFESFQAEVWDKQLESDLKAGRLEPLVQEAHRAFDTGNFKEF